MTKIKDTRPIYEWVETGVEEYDVFIAFDGERFHTKEACEMYEKIHGNCFQIPDDYEFHIDINPSNRVVLSTDIEACKVFLEKFLHPYQEYLYFNNELIDVNFFYDEKQLLSFISHNMINKSILYTKDYTELYTRDYIEEEFQTILKFLDKVKIDKHPQIK